MAYEAEIRTDRTVRRKARVSRLGWRVASMLRTNYETNPYRLEVLTEFFGGKVTFGVRSFGADPKTPDKIVYLCQEVSIYDILNNNVVRPTNQYGTPLPVLLPGEPDLSD